MRKLLVLMALAVCLMMAAPAAMAIPGKPDGGGNGAKYSIVTGDFSAIGVNQGKWTDGNTRWFVMFWYAINQLPPGGHIDVANVPSITIYNYANGVTELHWDTHGEDMTLPVATKQLVSGKQYQTGKDIGNIALSFMLYNYNNYYTSKGHRVDLRIELLSNQFDAAKGQWVNIQASKTEVRVWSNAPLPFIYRDWNSEGPVVFGSGLQSFDITMDK